MHIADTFVAYQFDSAVRNAGVAIENKMNELDDKGKPKHELRDILKDADDIMRGKKDKKPISNYDIAMAARARFMEGIK